MQRGGRIKNIDETTNLVLKIHAEVEKKRRKGNNFGLSSQLSIHVVPFHLPIIYFVHPAVGLMNLILKCKEGRIKNIAQTTNFVQNPAQK